MKGSEIKKARIEARLTQQELGRRAGVTYVAISNIENDKVKPYPLTLSKLASALGLPYDHFISEGQ